MLVVRLLEVVPENIMPLVKCELSVHIRAGSIYIPPRRDPKRRF